MKRLLATTLLTFVLAFGFGDRMAPDQAVAMDGCSAANATRTTVAAVAKNPEKWNGRCVKVTAILYGNWLYENVDGLYELTRKHIDPTSNGLRLGVDDQRPDAGDSGDLHETTIIGRVQDCEAVRAMIDRATPDGSIVMVHGYCHYYNGPYLWVVSLKQGPYRPFERQTVRKSATYGDLVPAPADWPHRATAEALAAHFLAVLQARDEAALARMMTPAPDGSPDGDTLAMVRFLLHVPSSPFVDLPAQGAPRTVILVGQYLDDGALKTETGSYSSLVCFCLKPECAGRWPIAAFDADNRLGRPYACIDVHPYIVHKKGTFPVVSVPVEKTGLTEPVG